MISSSILFIFLILAKKSSTCGYISPGHCPNAPEALILKFSKEMFCKMTADYLKCQFISCNEKLIPFSDRPKLKYIKQS